MVLPSLEMGGAERVSVALINNLSRQHFTLHVIVCGDEDGPLSHELPENLNIVFLRKSRVRHALRAILSHTRQLKPNLLFLNLSYLNLLVAIFRSFLPRQTKVIARETNVVSLNNLNYRLPAFWNVLYRAFYSRLDHIICQTTVMQTDLVAKYAVAKERTTVISNPVDVNKILELSRDEPSAEPMDHHQASSGGFDVTTKKAGLHLLSASGLRPEKNLDGLIRGFHKAGTRNIVLEILGDGPERPRLEAMVQRLGLQQTVTFTGMAANPFRTMSQADAVILTSHNEGLPNVLLEALALGKQIISTPAGGTCNELLDGLPGCVLAQSASDDHIAAAIDLWAESRADMPPSQLPEKFHLDQIMVAYESLFQSVRT